MAEKKKLGRPPTGETKQHNVRVDDDLWKWCLDRARAEGSSITKWITEDLAKRRADREEAEGDGAAG